MKEYECPYCGTIQTEDEMEFDEHDEPAYCFMCGAMLIDHIMEYIDEGYDYDFTDAPGFE